VSADLSVSGTGHRGVERIAFILETVAASEHGVRLAEMTALLGAPRSSVHSLLRGLVAVSYLTVRDNRYVIGPGIQRLLAPHRNATVVEAARDEIEALSQKFDETTLLGTMIGDQVVYLYQVESRQSIHYTAKLGEPRPAYATTTGKLFLAGGPEDELERVRRRLVGVDLSDFDAQIHTAQTTGLAYNREETVRGVTAVAAALHDRSGSVVASIAVVGPVYRMGDRLEEMGAEVRAAASRVSYRLAAIDHEVAVS